MSDFVEIVPPKPAQYYHSIFWRYWAAPVVPPGWVVKKLRAGGVAYVDWENEWHPWYTMYYRTEWYRNKAITRLKNGSIKPIKGWLYFTPPPG